MMNTNQQAARTITSIEDEGVINLWVKSYDQYNRLSVNPNHLTVAEARADYAVRIADDRTAFAQFGANTIDGAIVLGEFRKDNHGGSHTVEVRTLPPLNLNNLPAFTFARRHSH